MRRDHAERGLVAQLLRKPDETNTEAISRIMESPPVDSEMFEDAELRSMYLFITDSAEDGISLLPETLASEFDQEPDSIYSVLEHTDMAEVPLYANSVQRSYLNRKVSVLSLEIQKLVAEGNAEAVLEKLSTFNGAHVDEEKRIYPIAEQATLFLEKFRQTQLDLRSSVPRVTFPIPGLNEKIPRIMSDDVVLLTAPSKTGKSSFASQMALQNAKKGFRVALFHFEDNEEKMGYRRAAQAQIYFHKIPTAVDGLPYSRMFGKQLNPAEMKEVERLTAFTVMNAPGLTYIYSSGWTCERMIAVWKRLHAENPFDLVIVDYLNKMELSTRKLKDYGAWAGRGQDVELIKRTAGRPGHNVPVLLVQQENDTGVSKGQGRDTRESLIKSQAWISLTRLPEDEELGTLRLDGYATVKRANDGEQGSVPVRFFPRFMVWYQTTK